MKVTALVTTYNDVGRPYSDVVELVNYNDKLYWKCINGRLQSQQQIDELPFIRKGSVDSWKHVYSIGNLLPFEESDLHYDTE